MNLSLEITKAEVEEEYDLKITDEEWNAFVLDSSQAWMDDAMTAARERLQEFREDQEED